MLRIRQKSKFDRLLQERFNTKKRFKIEAEAASTYFVSSWRLTVMNYEFDSNVFRFGKERERQFSVEMVDCTFVKKEIILNGERKRKIGSEEALRTLRNSRAFDGSAAKRWKRGGLNGSSGSSSTVRTRVRETADGLRSSRNMQTLLIREWATLGREWLHLGIREPWTVEQARFATLVDRPTFDSRDLNGCPFPLLTR